MQKKFSTGLIAFLLLFSLHSCTNKFLSYQSRYGNREFVKANQIEHDVKTDKSNSTKTIVIEHAKSSYKIDDEGIEHMLSKSEELCQTTNTETDKMNQTKSLISDAPPHLNLVRKEDNSMQSESIASILPQKSTLKNYTNADFMWDMKPIENNSNHTLAILSLVFGASSCVGYCGGPVFGLAAIIMGVMAMTKNKKGARDSNISTLATLGIIFGAAGFVGWILYAIFMILLVSATSGGQ